MEHLDIPASKIHQPHNWQWPDAAARLAEAGIASMINKFGLQTDNNTLWRLASIAPTTWVQVANTAAWAAITGKPTTFPPSTHGHAIGDVTGLQDALDGKQPSGSYEAAGAAAAAVTAHEAAADPHTQYTTTAESDADIAAAMTAHKAEVDPHTQYMTSAEVATAIAGKYDKTGGPVTGPVDATGDISTLGVVRVKNATAESDLVFDAPDATTSAELQLFGGVWNGDFDSSEATHGVRLGGSYLALESSDISMQLQGALAGARVVVAGLTERGNAILAVEAPPVPDYVVQATGVADTPIYTTGTLPSPWVSVGDVLTVGKDIAARAATIFFELLVENTGSKDGTFEIGISINGAVPTAVNSISYALSAGVKQLYASTAINANALANGTTATLQARAVAQVANGFSIVAKNAERPSLLKLSVVGSGGGVAYLPLTGGDVSGPVAFKGGVTLGDAAADPLTINSSTVSIPNGLNFSGGNTKFSGVGAYVSLVSSTPGYTALFGYDDTVQRWAIGQLGHGGNSCNIYAGATNTLVAVFEEAGNILAGTDTTTGNKGIQIRPNAGNPGQGLISIDHSVGTISGFYYASFNYAGASIGGITQSGTTAVLYNTTSDYRLKDLIGPLTGSGAFIDALKPCSFTWKSDGTQAAGFLAHEFQEVSPSSVSGEKDATQTTVDEEGVETTQPQYQAMQASSTEVMANIIAELQSLRLRVAALEAQGGA